MKKHLISLVLIVALAAVAEIFLRPLLRPTTQPDRPRWSMPDRFVLTTRVIEEELPSKPDEFWSDYISQRAERDGLEAALKSLANVETDRAKARIIKSFIGPSLAIDVVPVINPRFPNPVPVDADGQVGESDEDKKRAAEFKILEQPIDQISDEMLQAGLKLRLSAAYSRLDRTEDAKRLEDEAARIVVAYRPPWIDWSVVGSWGWGILRNTILIGLVATFWTAMQKRGVSSLFNAYDSWREKRRDRRELRRQIENPD